MKKEGASSGFYHILWKFFSSVKLTVIILLSLAATSIIGTLIPQNKNPEEYVQAFGEFYYQILHFLDIFDMYHSWWFQLLFLLLTINVVVCSWNRLPAVWKIVFVKKPDFTIARFQGLSDKEEFLTGHSPGELVEIFDPLISKDFSYVRRDTIDQGFCIFGDKGRWTRLGVYTVHLSFILLLLGGLIGSIFGFDGFVSIPEGETVSSIGLRGGQGVHPLGFEIRCDDFNVSFYDSGMPREYRSSVTIIERGKPVVTKEIIVNDPLRYKGINLFQSTYGALKPKEADLVFEITESGVKYTQKVKVGEEISIPEDRGTFLLRDFYDPYSFRGHNIGEVFFGILTEKDRDPVRVTLPLRFPNFDKMRKGDVIISVSAYEPLYYTGLQVTKDPGVWVVYGGFILMIVGSLITFFMSHQRLCVEIRKTRDGSRVVISGIANRNKPGMGRKIKNISERLKSRSEGTL